MERDPICGFAMDPNATRPELVLSVNGKTYYFCSIRCKMEFEEVALPALRITARKRSAPRKRELKSKKRRKACGACAE